MNSTNKTALNLMIKKLVFLLLSLLFVFSNPGIGERREIPKSFTLAENVMEKVKPFIMPPVDAEALIKEDEDRESKTAKPVPYRFAKDFAVNLRPKNSGKSIQLQDGSRLWFLRIRSQGAHSLNLGITRFDLPAGAKLWIYNRSGDYVGPYMTEDSTMSQLWTPAIPGEEIVVELYVPAYVSKQPVIVIGKVNHDYRGFFKIDSSNNNVNRPPCCIDVLCPEVEPRQNQVRSAALYMFNGTYSCSGLLLNNTARDFTPYFLTAYHCGVNCCNAHTMVIYWNYQSPSCSECVHGKSVGWEHGNKNDYQAGAFFRAGWEKSDFVLVELKENPHPGFNVYYSGWDARGNTPCSAFGLHHPNGKEKSYCFSNHSITSTGKDSDEVDPKACYWRIERWEKGTTENCSSGSGLWNAHTGLCIGQLWGGEKGCDEQDQCQPINSPNWYGKFSASWEGGRTPDTQLKFWLNPRKSDIRMLKGAAPPGDCNQADSSFIPVKGSLKQVSVGCNGTVWGLDRKGGIFKWTGSDCKEWEKIPGPHQRHLTQVSVGCDGTVWGLDQNGGIFKWIGKDSKKWEPIPNSPKDIKQISVGCEGMAWAVDKQDNIYKWIHNSKTWQSFTGCTLKQVSVTCSGTVWGVDQQGQIFKWTGNDCENKTQIRGSLKQVSIGCDGTVWGVDNSDRIFKLMGYNCKNCQEWKPIPGSLKQVSVGCSGLVWGVNKKDRIYRWIGEKWKPIDGTLRQLKQVSVGHYGMAWGVDEKDNVYKWNKNFKIWESIPGSLTQVSVGCDGTVWGVDKNHNIYNRTGKKWKRIRGSLKQVSVLSKGTVWGVDKNNHIYRWAGDKWRRICGSLKQVSVESEDMVWGVDNDNHLYKWYDKCWHPIHDSPLLKQITAACNRGWGVNENGHVFKLNEKCNIWQPIAGSLKYVSVGCDGTVWGVDKHGQVCTLHLK